MDSLIDRSRPPAFCPGCTHEKIVTSLDQALTELEIPGNRVVIVSDIGCSGLFDTFFNTHAFHGLHGRALTYATGLKMANPDLTVIVTMGDGGVGIGGAHLLAACRRNLDITLFVLNNFNFGMTGGQFSATTPTDAETGSLFLNHLERPVDVCSTASAAGAGFVTKISGLDKKLYEHMSSAISHNGFSLLETYGICTGRFTKRNRLSPKIIDNMIQDKPESQGVVAANQRPEFGESYRSYASGLKKSRWPIGMEKKFDLAIDAREEIMILGSAGMRVITAGELLCYGGILAGLHVSQKNDYNITVLRGQSVSEMIVSRNKIVFTGIVTPGILIVLGEDGVVARKEVFDKIGDDGLVLLAKGLSIPPCSGEIITMDFKSSGIRKPDWALASLAVLAKLNRCISREVLDYSISLKFKDELLISAREVVEKARGCI